MSKQHALHHPRPLRLAAALAAALLTASVAGTAFADAADAHIPPPKDTPYLGTIQLHVDATDVAQGIFRVHETIPVRAGELTLLYPKWIPGNHEPSGPIDKLAGLVISANGKRLPWTRDKYDVYAFRVTVPQGVSSIDLKFQYLSSRGSGEGPIEMTSKMLDLTWHKDSLYPAGYYSRDITFAPSMTIPVNWKFGTALEVQSQSGNTVTFKPTTYNTLVDSPVYAGINFKRLDLNPGDKAGNAPVHMDIVADSPSDLVVSPQQLQGLRNVVTQAHRLFQSHHYNHYDFLFSVSDELSGKGLEHHQSSEDGARADYFTKWKENWPTAGNLLAHEYTHSWNGKFRRPADLWTPNFNVPMGDSLLWVYEGQTQYWGYVLATRAGLWTPDQFHQAMATIAAIYDRDRPGFQWRTVEDTTNDPTIAQRAPLPYRNWQMSEEYYTAGQMMWLAADAKIRSLTHGKKSLDTFAKDFFGIDNGSFVTKTYTFNDVVNALNGVVKYDWAGFLHRYLDQLNPPFDQGLESTGWKLVYTDQPNAFVKLISKRFHADIGSAFGIGLQVGKGGVIRDVRWNGPAFKAGIGSGETVVAVNGEAYTAEVLNDAVKAAKDDKAPIELLLKYQGQYKTVPVDYHGGLQYPHLERIKGTPDYLDQIVKAK
ncbi:MAG: M61 family peptidase [Rhodanobacteraceae bacterium]|nr:MAG: M61 family peptidase [Rhodanobacteraceae bacterium]